MAHFPETPVSLLTRIRDTADAASWALFVEIYTPLVYDLARRRGLQPADAADVTQEVLLTVAKDPTRYDRNLGRFHDWLYTVTLNEARSFWSRQHREPRGSGETGVHAMLREQPDDAAEVRAWDEAYRELLDRAGDRVRPDFKESTWRAFCATAIEGQNPQQVAEALGLSVQAVYIARSRVLAALKKAIRAVRDEE